MRLYKPEYKGERGARKESAVWWLDYYDRGRRRRVSLGIRDRRAAELKAAEIIRNAELRAAGLETFDDTRDRPLKDLASEYLRELERKRLSAAHVRHTGKAIARLIRAARVRSITELTSEKIESALGTLAHLSPRAQNYARAALFAFFGWLVESGRWHQNPVAAVKRVKETGPLNPKRALTEAELARLLVEAPRERAMVYLVAAATGLRRGELAALRWGDLDLERLHETGRRGRAGRGGTARCSAPARPFIPAPFGIPDDADLQPS